MFKKVFEKNVTEGNTQKEVRLKTSHRLLKSFLLRFLRLQKGEPVLEMESKFFYGRKNNFSPSSLLPVRLSDDTDHFIGSLQKAPQGGDGKRWGSKENDPPGRYAQGLSSLRFSFFNLFR